MKIKGLFVFVIIALFCYQGRAQFQNTFHNSYVSMGIAGSCYIGSTHTGYGGGVDFTFGKWLLTSAGIRAQLSAQYLSHASASGLYCYGHADLFVDLLTSLKGRNPSNVFRSYLLVGIGLARSPQGDRDFCGFFGLGADFKVSKDWRLYAELSSMLHPSDFDDNTSDYLAEGLMRSVIHSSRIAVKNPQDYEARSNIMWTATWALNTLIGLGKQQDWMVHMIGHSVGAWTHAPHGYALASVSMAYYRRAMKNGLPKFVRFAKNVWNIQGDGMTDEQIAEAGLQALKAWMLEIGLPLTISELGATAEMIPGITEGTICYPAGYLNLTKDDVTEILKESM